MNSFVKPSAMSFSLLLSACVVMSSVQAAEPQATEQAPGESKPVPSRHFPTSLSLTYITTGEGDIDNTPLHLQQDTLQFDLNTTFPISSRWAVSVGAGYDKLDFDWGNRGVVLANVSDWSSVERYKANVAVSYVMNKHWMFMVAPTMQYAYAEGTSASNAQSYGLLGTGMLRLSDGSSFGFGLAYLNDINEVRTLPFVMVNWQINDKWRLGNPFAAGFSGPGGVEISYKLTKDIELGAGTAMRTQRFLVRDDDTTMEIKEIVSFLRAGWTATPALTVSGYLGYYFNGELELSDPKTTEDVDNQLALGVSAKYTF
ncbi:DUF6268 family outer membrane beta-barrel protein [Shewanella sp. Isolate11]|uniref:DUF6268 family outer membrane beta-barrel protein n=1 Tax=Shewanella sp. Isolate11 TaxID=2908530 RepID=UPI001EFE070A|nr:DUF6268 family outer membrane beta-barrel protein [Shewanella sp. Isolate11]MCG9697190.1 DUF6268 family outer membrane beta-barrel protein [Shewanella sp. Isolate11]